MTESPLPVTLVSRLAQEGPSVARTLGDRELEQELTLAAAAIGRRRFAAFDLLLAERRERFGGAPPRPPQLFVRDA